MTAALRPEPLGRHSTDAQLAIAATGGDRTAFALIYDRYADKLHDFSVGMLRDREAAADCVQDAFCTAATKLTDLRDPDRLRPWLYSVTRNEALRRIRERRRELLSDEVPDMASTEAGPDVLAARTELADLIAEAAGGLSDRDRTVLQLAYHHGMDGPELAEALEVSPSAATKMVQRLRDTVEKSLGALLVCKRAKADPAACPELATILEGWDGNFTVLMRKRVARHIESCPVCDDERRRRVTPAALLGATPIAIPAPVWLRDRTLDEVRLPAPSTPPGGPGGPGEPAAPGGSAGVGAAGGGSRQPWPVTAALVAGLALVGIVVTILARQADSRSVVPADFRAPDTTTTVSRPPAGLQLPPSVATTPTTTPAVTTTAPAPQPPPTSIAGPPPPSEEPAPTPRLPRTKESTAQPEVTPTTRNQPPSRQEPDEPEGAQPEQSEQTAAPQEPDTPETKTTVRPPKPPVRPPLAPVEEATTTIPTQAPIG